MPTKNVTIEPAELFERASQVAAAEGKTLDELTVEALQRELARRTLERLARQGTARRTRMTDEQVESTVNRAVHDTRRR